MTPEQTRSLTELVEQAYRTGYRTAVSDAITALDASRLPDKNLSIILVSSQLITTPPNATIELMKRDLTGMMQ